MDLGGLKGERVRLDDGVWLVELLGLDKKEVFLCFLLAGFWISGYKRAELMYAD